MIGWLQLNAEQRKSVIDEAEQLSGISAKVIEKDWWVTLTLKALFQSAYREHMVFKGGTSLSKGWDLISRFSEDIDIALDPQVFQMEYVEAPSRGYLNNLKRAGCEFTSNQLKDEVENQLRGIGVPDGILTIEAAPVPETMPDTDPQTIIIHYPSLYPDNRYILNRVKIEVGVRSRRIPFTSVPIQSMLHSINPKAAYAETPFSVEAVEPRKTLIEKVFLLHEEFGKADKTRIRTERMSRHLYDLFKMMNSPRGAEALADHGLYDALIQHRQWYNRISWVDYASLSHETVTFIPVAEVFEEYRSDYQTMQEEMIYEETVSFDEMIYQLLLLRGRFRVKYEQKSLEEIIAQATTNLHAWPKFDKEEGALYSTLVEYRIEPDLPASPSNRFAKYQVHFIYQKGQLIFKDVSVEGV